MSHGLKRVLMDMNRRLGSVNNYIAAGFSDEEMSDDQHHGDSGEQDSVHPSKDEVKILKSDVDVTHCSGPMKDIFMLGSQPISLLQHSNPNIAILVIGYLSRTYKFVGDFNFFACHTPDIYYTLEGKKNSEITLGCIDRMNGRVVYEKLFSSFLFWEGRWDVLAIQVAEVDDNPLKTIPWWNVNCETITMQQHLLTMLNIQSGTLEWSVEHPAYSSFYATMNVAGGKKIDIECNMRMINYNRIALEIETRNINPEGYACYEDTASYMLTRKT